jgi:hypothetical protein
MSEVFKDGFLDEIVQAYVRDFGERVETTDRFEHYAPGHARRVAEVSVARRSILKKKTFALSNRRHCCTTLAR